MQKMQSLPEWQKPENSCSDVALTWSVEQAGFEDDATRRRFSEIRAYSLVVPSGVEIVHNVAVDRVVFVAPNHLAEFN